MPKITSNQFLIAHCLLLKHIGHHWILLYVPENLYTHNIYHIEQHRRRIHLAQDIHQRNLEHLQTTPKPRQENGTDMPSPCMIH